MAVFIISIKVTRIFQLFSTHYARLVIPCVIVLSCLISFNVWSAVDQNLPTLGDATSGIVSLNQEREIGQGFLRSLRASAPTVDDPLLQDYLEHLIYRLVYHSQLKDRRLDLVIVKSPVLNAFAVPGGIVGVHHGLFFYAETEHELSAILTHELAHISQRHYARGVEQGKKTMAITIAGLLASIVLMTTVGSDAGMAALTAAQGAGLSQQLRHSRAREAEADRVGITNLNKAEMDPRAMAYMFERLEQATRYNTDQIPEFLRSHPVTRLRIADAYNQTESYARKEFPPNIDFQLMKARAKVITADSTVDLIPVFLKGMSHEDKVKSTANAYGLVLSLTAKAELDEAMTNLRPLLENYPDKIALLAAEAEIHLKAERYDTAISLLETALSISPDNYPLTMIYARVLNNVHQFEEAQKVLLDLTSRRRNDDYLWYHLAETAGLADDIPGVHWARTEYFVLRGNFDQALKQLEYGLPLVRRNFQLETKMKQKIAEIQKLKEN